MEKAAAVAPNKGAWANDLTGQRAQTVIAMVKQRATLEETGKAIGVTRERARQVIKEITAAHGKQVFEPQERLWTMSQAAKELGVSRYVIMKRMKARGLASFRRWGKREIIVIDEAGMEALRRHLCFVCAVCEKRFVYKRGQGNRLACPDPSCIKEVRRRQYAAVLEKEPSLDSLAGWHRELWEKLRERETPENEQWVSVSEGAAYCGLSRMQVVWLQQRRIVRVRPHPKTVWWAKPITLLALSELKIAGEVFRAHKEAKDARRP